MTTPSSLETNIVHLELTLVIVGRMDLECKKIQVVSIRNINPNLSSTVISALPNRTSSRCSVIINTIITTRQRRRTS